jgi:hypothetical protein
MTPLTENNVYGMIAGFFITVTINMVKEAIKFQNRNRLEFLMEKLDFISEKIADEYLQGRVSWQLDNLVVSCRLERLCEEILFLDARNNDAFLADIWKVRKLICKIDEELSLIMNRLGLYGKSARLVVIKVR